VSRNVIGRGAGVCALSDGTARCVAARSNATAVKKVRAIMRGAYARETVRSRRAIERIIPA